MTLQWTDKVEALATAVGSAAALVGLAAVIVQLRHLTEGLRSSARRATYDIGVQIKLTLIEHPHLRPFFFDNTPVPPGHPEASRIASLAELYCIYFQEIAEQSRNVRPRDRIAWKSLVRSMYQSSPSIRGQFEGHLAWYSAELREFVEDLQREPSAG
ncbi:hypothetical protein [Streptomyces violarus]|uniref:hypothetical protein n=1 Tax=Streptomyces violarus TaxID=67380 RepID=UPI0021BDF2AC|nr:hypothetical protein [Streptomyces violarus]MCT9137889.1 hypothetical protein [Streptomyces violarus]